MDAPLLTEHWRSILTRGLFSVLFGVLAFAWPINALYSLALVFGAYVLVDGLLAIAVSFRRNSNAQPWGILFAEGLLGVVIGVFSLVWPGLTLLMLIVVIAFWAILTGALELYAAFEIRASMVSSLMWALAGLSSLTLGGMTLLKPDIGAVAWIEILAFYAVVFGAFTTAAALQLRKEQSGGRDMDSFRGQTA